MKKWMSYVVIVGLTAGTASAAWWPFGGNKTEETEMEKSGAEVPQEPRHSQMSPEQIEKMKARREGGGQDRQQMNSARMQKAKEIQALGEAARAETDPVKKEAMVAQLRAKLVEVADKMQAENKIRMEQAEDALVKLKERMADAEANKTARIEEQIQRILAGKSFRPVDGKHSDGAPQKDGKKDAKKGGKKQGPPAEE